MIYNKLLNVVELCKIASQKSPREWDSRVITTPVSFSGRLGYSIFGSSHIEIASDYAISLIDALVETKLSESNGQARNSIKSGAVRINGNKCTDVAKILSQQDMIPALESIVIENGKKNYGIIEIIHYPLNSLTIYKHN